MAVVSDNETDPPKEEERPNTTSTDNDNDAASTNLIVCAFCNEEILVNDNDPVCMRNCAVCGINRRLHQKCMKQVFKIMSKGNPALRHIKEVTPKVFLQIRVSFFCSMCRTDCFYCGNEDHGSKLLFPVIFTHFNANVTDY